MRGRAGDTVGVVAGFAEHIVHLDMDAFFVEVERLRRPELVGRPVLVGGGGERGVVASASYEARRRGARSAMPMAHARRMVPGAVVVTPDHGEYSRVSAEVFSVLDRFSPVVEPLSIDEAFVDIAGLHRHHDSPAGCADAMRSAIRREVGLPSSAGIATTKFLAKMASREAKPDGLFVVAAGAELDFLHPQPVRALWGVGAATHARIEELGLETIGDLAAFPRDTLVRRLGEAIGGALWDLAHGRDDRAVGDSTGTRSISVEQTYERDLDRSEDIERELLAHADRLAGRLRRSGLLAGSIHLKVRYPDFTTVTRSHTFAEPVASSAVLYEEALRLLARTEAGVRGVRLLGLGGDHLVDADAPRQLGLDSGPWEAVDETVEAIRERFGSGAVGRARLGGGTDSGRKQPPSG
jgi:DNA polymerase-4